jgi:nitroreductase
MTGVLDFVFHRIIRSNTGQPVTPELLLHLLQAGMAAPIQRRPKVKNAKYS